MALCLGFTENKGLASLENLTSSSLACRAFESQSDLPGLLCFLSEDGFSLTTEALLLGLVSPISKSKTGFLAGLVLSHFMNCMLLAFLTVRVSSLGSVHLQNHG